VCWHPAPRRKKGQATAADAGASVEASGLPRTVGTICADTHPGAYTGQDAYTGRLIPAVLQPVCATGNQTHCLTASSGKGATEDGTGRGTPIVIDRAAFNQGENAQYEPHIEQTDVMDSLVARGPHAVGVPFRKSKRAQSTTDDESLVVADASNTLNNFDLGDTRTTHAVVEPVIPIHDQATRFAGKHGNKQDGKGNGLGIGQPGDPMNTLTRGDKHAVYTPPMAVRRLTPRETERLQGFPDDWSKIPWKGKPADQCPDGPRYKCAGNSMAVPVMRWIGEQIARVELSTQQPK
jgi:site-specific DNA-cytosine methylase